MTSRWATEMTNRWATDTTNRRPTNTIEESTTILLVEDDPNDVLLMQRALRDVGLLDSLRVVKDGDEAVAYLSGKDDYADRERFPIPALVLLDLKVPRRSGHEVLGWLRSQPGLRRLPVVVLSASEQRSDIDKAYDLGANSYLVKPSAPHALLEITTALRLYWLTLNAQPRIPLEVSHG